MAEATNAGQYSHRNFVFNTKSDEEKEKLLTEKDKKSIQKSTKSALKQLREFLQLRNLPDVYNLTDDQLPDILFDFYSSVRPRNSEKYATQSLKCIRAALNRFFRKERGLDIIKDTGFVRTNEMFKGVLVDAHKSGKPKKSTPKISQIDLERIGEYFQHDYMNSPNPKKLQQNMVFFILYFFCRRGRENLYDMTIETFELVTEYDGTQYVKQSQEECNKNHGPDDGPSNDGRMYEIKGKSPEHILIHLISLKIHVRQEQKNLTVSKTTPVSRHHNSKPHSFLLIFQQMMFFAQ